LKKRIGNAVGSSAISESIRIMCMMCTLLVFYWYF